MFIHCAEWAFTFQSIECVALLDGFADGLFVQTPQFQRVIHAGRHYTIAVHIEVSTQYFIAMPFDAAEYRDAHIRLYVPQSQRMIFACRQQEVRFLRVEFQLVNGMSMTYVVFVAGE